MQINNYNIASESDAYKALKKIDGDVTNDSIRDDLNANYFNKYDKIDQAYTTLVKDLAELKKAGSGPATYLKFYEEVVDTLSPEEAASFASHVRDNSVLKEVLLPPSKDDKDTFLDGLAAAEKDQTRNIREKLLKKAKKTEGAERKLPDVMTKGRKKEKEAAPASLRPESFNYGVENEGKLTGKINTYYGTGKVVGFASEAGAMLYKGEQSGLSIKGGGVYEYDDKRSKDTLYKGYINPNWIFEPSTMKGISVLLGPTIGTMSPAYQLYSRNALPTNSVSPLTVNDPYVNANLIKANENYIGISLVSAWDNKSTSDQILFDTVRFKNLRTAITIGYSDMNRKSRAPNDFSFDVSGRLEIANFLYTDLLGAGGRVSSSFNVPGVYKSGIDASSGELEKFPYNHNFIAYGVVVGKEGFGSLAYTQARGVQDLNQSRLYDLAVEQNRKDALNDREPTYNDMFLNMFNATRTDGTINTTSHNIALNLDVTGMLKGANKGEQGSVQVGFDYNKTKIKFKDRGEPSTEELGDTTPYRNPKNYKPGSQTYIGGRVTYNILNNFMIWAGYGHTKTTGEIPLKNSNDFKTGLTIELK